jgi:hypothetical protein
LKQRPTNSKIIQDIIQKSFKNHSKVIQKSFYSIQFDTSDKNQIIRPDSIRFDSTCWGASITRYAWRVLQYLTRPESNEIFRQNIDFLRCCGALLLLLDLVQMRIATDSIRSKNQVGHGHSILVLRIVVKPARRIPISTLGVYALLLSVPEIHHPRHLLDLFDDLLPLLRLWRIQGSG